MMSLTFMKGTACGLKRKNALIFGKNRPDVNICWQAAKKRSEKNHASTRKTGWFAIIWFFYMHDNRLPWWKQVCFHFHVSKRQKDVSCQSARIGNADLASSAFGKITAVYGQIVKNEGFVRNWLARKTAITDKEVKNGRLSVKIQSFRTRFYGQMLRKAAFVRKFPV